MPQGPLGELRGALRSYPYPISAIFARYFAVPESDVHLRHAILGDCFESTLKFIAVVALKDAGRSSSLLGQAFPTGLDFLKRPSLGHWLSVVRQLSRAVDSNVDGWMRRISDWYLLGQMDGRVLDSFSTVTGIAVNSGGSPIESSASALVTYRNKIWKGHGAQLTDRVLASRLATIEKLLAQFVGSASFLAEMGVLCVNEVKVLAKGKYQVSCVSLSGTDRDHVQLLWDEALENGEIYATPAGALQLTSAPLALGPFVDWRAVEDRDAQFYFFNDAQRTKLEYLCYLDGSFYYHRELKSEFERFVKIKLEQTAQQYEDVLHNYSVEERVEMARAFHVQGLELMTQQRYDDAIIAFEDSLEWSKEVAVLVDKCKALVATGEDHSYILSVLEYCFELDPNYLPALKLKDSLPAPGPVKPAIVTVTETEVEASAPSADDRHLLYDVLAPRAFRERGTLFCAMVAAVVYIGLPLIAISTGDRESGLRLLLVGGVFLAEIYVMMLGMVTSRHRFRESYYSLLGQVETMKTEAFSKWYEDQSSSIYGHFNRVERGVVLNWKREKRFLVVWSLLVVGFIVQAFQVQQLSELTPIVAMSQLIFTGMFFLLIVPPARYVIASTQFMKRYGSLSLSPVISSGGHSGYDRVLALFLHNLILVNIIWLLNWSWNALIVRDPYHLDFIGLTFGALLVGFWMVFTPLYMYRALQLSQSIDGAKYRNHVRQAFKAFIKTPNDATKERVQWLVNNEAVIASVTRRIIGPRVVLAVLFSLILIAGSGAVYVLQRLDRLTRLWP